MTDTPSSGTKYKGPIAWMARNHVAANLLMIIVLVGGFLGILRSKQEVFPEFSLDLITVQVPYPGASPEETEQGIVLAVEEAVRGIDGVKRVTSSAGESIGSVTIELILGANADKVVADVKNAVDRIITFPENAEKPIVKLLEPKSRVLSLILYGDRDLRELHQLAERARSELLSIGGITQVEVDGIPPLEVSIDVPGAALEKYGLTLAQVAREVRAASVEIPGGSVKTKGGEVLVRVTDRRKSGHEFENIILRSTVDGSQIRLGDIAQITDGFEQTDSAAYFNGQRAVRVTAYRVGDETPKGVAEVTRDYGEKLQSELPEGIGIAQWQDDSELLTGRINLLLKNAAIGGVLVFFLLAVFLNLSLAWWVALGIPISFMGAFFLMPAADASINMITLFAFIVTLGMVVDDAIVVGENIYEKFQEGKSRLQAAIEGAREMAMPVTFSILTTMAAFAPMFFVPGIMGKIFRLIPFVVLIVLVASLLESFYVLPAHLSHSRGTMRKEKLNFFDRFQERVGRRLHHFTHHRYKPFVELVVNYRYLALAIAISVLASCVGLVMGGVVPFRFFPDVEGDLVQVTAKLPYGTPVERTEEIQAILEEAAYKGLEDHGGRELLRGMYSSVGAGPSVRRGPHAGAGGAGGSHLATIELNLVPSAEREASSEDIRAAWQAHTPKIAGLKSIAYKASMGPSAGAAVDVQLTHRDIRILETASERLTDQLRGFSDLANIENSFSEGKTQLDFRLLPEARTLGLSSSEIAHQIRGAFYGREAIREQRGRNELKVMVRYPESERRSEFDIETMLIRTPRGGHVPLSYVAQFDRNRAPTVITREEGKRTVNVTGELAPGVVSPGPVLATLQQKILPELVGEFPELNWEMAGEQREQKESFKALGMNFAVALFVMFALIAIPFKSYIQPVIIMSAIPFGFVGAILGHLVMGFSLSIISMFGIVALAGVVVNDSLVLIDATNKARERGMTAREAIVWGGTRRLRPILLTSLTTFLGLAPMILETSLQARFLIPMAISLGFGVLFATFIILLLVPALYMIIEDVRKFGPGEKPAVE